MLSPMKTQRPVLELREEALTALRLHIAIPSDFVSRTVLDVVSQGKPHELRERELVEPFRKDYDLVEDPMRWPVRFDTSHWTLIGAFCGDTRVGGAIGAFNSPGVQMLEGRNDLVVLWDLRVAPDARRQGVGSALFGAIEAWGQARRCRELKVETQNVNVAACRLYAAQGCALEEVNYGAYPDFPNEIQLIWRKALKP